MRNSKEILNSAPFPVHYARVLAYGLNPILYSGCPSPEVCKLRELIFGEHLSQLSSFFRGKEENLMPPTRLRFNNLHEILSLAGSEEMMEKGLSERREILKQASNHYADIMREEVCPLALKVDEPEQREYIQVITDSVFKEISNGLNLSGKFAETLSTKGIVPFFRAEGALHIYAIRHFIKKECEYMNREHMRKITREEAIRNIELYGNFIPVGGQAFIEMSNMEWVSFGKRVRNSKKIII